MTRYPAHYMESTCCVYDFLRIGLEKWRRYDWQMLLFD